MSDVIGPLVENLSPECISEMGKLLSRETRPGYRELAAKKLTQAEIEELERMNPTNPGAAVLEKWQRYPDTTVLALRHTLEDMKRHDVIRIIDKYIKEPCSFTLVVKERCETIQTIVSCSVSSFVDQYIEDALKSVQAIANVPIDRLQYVGETRLPPEGLRKARSGRFKGSQLTVLTCMCSHPETEQGFRNRSQTCPTGTRPKELTAPRMAISDNINVSQRHGLSGGQPSVYEALSSTQFDNIPESDMEGAVWGSLAPRRYVKDRHITPSTSGVSSGSGRDVIDSVTDGTEEDPTFNLDLLSREHDIKLQQEPDLKTDNVDSVYLTTSLDLLSDKPEVPPGFHDVTGKSQISTVFGTRINQNNCFLSRRSSRSPGIHYSISVTFGGNIENYRIHMHQTQSGMKYTLFENIGPYFSSMKTLFKYYSTHAMTEDEKGDGPYLHDSVP